MRTWRKQKTAPISCLIWMKMRMAADESERMIVRTTSLFVIYEY